MSANMLSLVTLISLVVAIMAAPQNLAGLFGVGSSQAQLLLPQQQPQQQVFVQQQQQAAAVQPQVSIQPANLIPAINPANFVSSAAADGSSLHGFQTIDGQVQQETIGADGSRRGSYSYLDANGKQVLVHYVADQHGYRSTNDPVSLSRGTLNPPPTTTQSPVPQQNPLAQFFPASSSGSLGHFGFQPIAVQQPQQQPQQQSVLPPLQFTLTGRR